MVGMCVLKKVCSPKKTTISACLISLELRAFDHWIIGSSPIRLRIVHHQVYKNGYQKG